MEEILLPRLGEGIHEVKLIKWIKKVGDFVAKDDVIAEVATDKVDSDVLADKEGYVAQLLFNPEDDVPVGEAIVVLSAEKEQIENKPNTKNEKYTKVIDEPATSKQNKKKKVTSKKAVLHNTPSPIVPAQRRAKYNASLSPLVRKIMLDNSIEDKELVFVQASGFQGRITKQDMLSYISQRQSNVRNKELSGDFVDSKQSFAIVEKNQEKKSTTNEEDATFKEVPSTKVHHNKIALDEQLPNNLMNTTSKAEDKTKNHTADVFQGEPMSRIRTLIADNMMQSLKRYAHVTSFGEADVSVVVKWKKTYSNIAQSDYGVRLTYTPIFMSAVLKALIKYPKMNVSLTDNSRVIYHKDICIGMAVALQDGNLMVPVIRNPLDFNLLGLSKQINCIVEQARGGTLSPEDSRGSTFTISNIGSTGMIFGTPIINPPNSAILAIGAIKKRPHIIEENGQDSIAIRSILYLSLSYDHRIIDGILGGLFLKQIIEELEKFNPHTRLI